MRKKIEWTFLTTVDSQIDLEIYFKQFPRTITNHTNSNNCTLCTDNSNSHKMKVKYPFCACSKTCPTRYMIMTCINTNKTTVNGLNIHTPSFNYNESDPNHGISKQFKEIIEEFILQNVTKPYFIYQQILLNYNENNSKPTLLQIQNYLKYHRKKHGDVNGIEGLAEFVEPKLNNMTNDDDPFYFGAEINDEEGHFHLGITSMKLLENVHNGCMFHLECTHKIVKYGFPVVIFGCSDIRHQFYPICYFVTSHEQETDFNFFWDSLIKAGESVGIDLIKAIKFICITPNKSIVNSIKTKLTESKIITSWNTLKEEISKNEYLVPQDIFDTLMNDITQLGLSSSESLYESQKKTILSRWKKQKILKKFIEYFCEKWIDQPFCNWQIFHTPPGYALSNDPIESYNDNVKKYFIGRVKFNLLPVFEIFENIVKLESHKNVNQVPTCALVTIKLKRKAKEQLEMVKKLEPDEDGFKYLCDDVYKVVVNKECFCPDCTYCSCCDFLEKAKCVHLVSCCLIDSIDFPGIKYNKLNETTVSKKRKLSQ